MKSAGTLLVLLVICAAAAAWVYAGMPGREAISAAPTAPTNVAAQRGSGSGPTRTIAVEVAEARATRTSTDIRAIGSLQSDETVQLAPEIAGRVSEIDFVEEIIGAAFKVHNPNATSSCGCGTSFSV